MGSAIPFIIWIFCIGVAALIIGKALGDDTPGIPLTLLEKKEGFVDLASVFRVTACPAGTTSYILSNGDTNCCSGDVVGNKCNGRDVCSLSPDPYNKNLGSCSSWLASEWARRAARFCPRSMNNYFGKMNRDAGSAEGCSASFPTPDGSQPSDAGQPKCKIYSNYNDEVSKQDSCANIKEMENLVCPTSNATKSFLTINGAPGKTYPLILKCGYMPPNGKSNGMPVDCMDDASVRRYLSVVAEPVSEEYLMNSVRFCRASKAYYIDGTLSAPPALDVPGSAAKAPVCPPAPACPQAGASQKTGCVKGIGKPNKDNTYTDYTPDECKSIGGTFARGGCFNSLEAFESYEKENNDLFDSAMKSGKYIIKPKNDAERESNKQFETLRNKTLGKKYMRNYDCHT